MVAKKKTTVVKKTRAAAPKSRAKVAKDHPGQFATVMVIVFTVLSIVFLSVVTQRYL